MRRFAEVVRLPQPQLLHTDFNIVLRDTFLFYQPTLAAKGVEFTLEVPAKPVLLKMDLQQIEQVLINIFKNAMEACAAGPTHCGTDLRLNTLYDPQQRHSNSQSIRSFAVSPLLQRQTRWPGHRPHLDSGNSDWPQIGNFR